MCGRISGVVYHEVEADMQYDAIKAGLTEREFQDIVNEVEQSLNYAQVHVYVAKYD